MRSTRCPQCDLLYMGDDLPDGQCPGCAAPWPKELRTAITVPDESSTELGDSRTTAAPSHQQTPKRGFAGIAFLIGAVLGGALMFAFAESAVDIPQTEAYQQLAASSTAADEHLAKVEARLREVSEQLGPAIEEAKSASAQLLKEQADKEALMSRVLELEQSNFGMRLATARSFAREWLILGPLPDETIEADILASPAPREGIVQGEKQWKSFTSEEDRINLHALLESRSNGVCYCVCWAYSDIDREVQLSVGSDDALYIWVNGRQVLANPTNRSASPDQDKVDALLNAGWNQLLCRVDNLGEGDWALFFEFRNRDARPLKIFSTSLAPPELVAKQQLN
ncbi:MAG: hypothetical protein KDA66_09975 [Planctomycetaceae bacterium]|nr:hypothetical protein [Planctomycetaceae bacterium]